MVRQHMVDVGGQVEPVMPDYTGDAHDTQEYLDSERENIIEKLFNTIK